MEVVIATGNMGKLAEFRQMLAPLDMTLRVQSEFNTESAEETGLTFVENAILKARHAARISGLPAIADDSGLEVEYLKGAPGIYSSRFSGENASDIDNIQKLLHELDGVPTELRKARFQCVLVYMRHADDPIPVICQGSWEGYILEQPLGDNGHGYDPVFFVPGMHCSAAELSAEQKNSMSHRAVAMAKLLEELKNL
ncbi:RdgB/HAM1 family non-canonical purine NTP pyrophosphatase [Parendozoicomonas haliclonae]|uniref:dITP/XTP pyrophosphatase n=1 Tax=Parendozoicomonas haliclonae TaxID=1960125 RepID=A0A1X7AJN6_9GAMM|nr:RdgB/HAM1 family non-canonical purine NTP pyrophosphatase [Parendozoicomonas haliclonae]SMA46208.1 dITP/XTP pyrophosphatase [Parendozoicomonas haliclonae]